MDKKVNPLLQVMTLSEAAREYGISRKTLQQYCIGQQGYPPKWGEEECRKSGGTWLLTRAAMDAVIEEKTK